MRIVILHASAGHGHEKAAQSIQEGFLSLGVPPQDLLVLDVLDETPRWFKKLYTAIYYYSIKHTPKAWGRAYDLFNHSVFYQKIAKPGRRFVNGLLERDLIRRMLRENPDAILCTHFLAPEVLGQLKEKGKLPAFLVTAVTDFLPHSFWINPGTDHYWVMSEEGKKDLEAWGVPPSKITVGGIPVALKFQLRGRKAEIRKREGLDEGRFTILVTSGSFGLGPAAEVLETLRSFGDTIQVVVVSGKNQDQYRALKARSYPFRTRIYGFVSHMDELMEASDLIVAKPGGATTAESLAKGVPMVVLEPIPGQEAGNAKVLKERNASFFLGEPKDIGIILKGILDYPEVLIEKKRAIERLARPESSLELAKFVLDQIGARYVR